jgi:hypothetical protein
VNLKLGNNTPLKVYSHNQFSLELASFYERGKDRMVHRIFTFTEERGIDLQIERVLTYKLKATTDTSYKRNAAYMRVWHQFRAQYDE